MKRILMTLIIAVLVGGCAAQGGLSSGRPNLLIMGEDSDPDAVARDSRVFKRVLDALAEEMNSAGFDVYDEVAVTLDDFTQGRTRRSDAEIIDIARSVKSVPIDVAAIFSIYTAAQERDHARKLSVRVTGRLLNVRNGRRLSNFETESPSALSVPSDCNRECEQERLGGEARNLARDLGAVLAKKLDWLVKPRARASAEEERPAGDDDDEIRSGLASAYSLTFSGFDSNEINDVEDMLASFSGYQHLRTVSSSLRTHEYWYETASGSARLNRNLRLMLDELGITARVAFAGNMFTVEKFLPD